MTTSMRNEPNDRDGSRPAAQLGDVQGKAKAVIRCRLCREMIVLESSFRPTPAVCPHCGLKFVFDPQGEPLPVRGMKLRYSEVVEAQRRPGGSYHRRHDAHRPRTGKADQQAGAAPSARLRGPAAVLRLSPSYLAWAGGTALAAAGFLALFGGWFQRFLGH